VAGCRRQACEVSRQLPRRAAQRHLHWIAEGILRALKIIVSSLTKAGRYELLEELGRGAMGVVYRAKDPVIGRDVAVKTIKLVEAGTGLTREELTTRFQTEARAAGLLTHPNIVVIYDAGEEDGQYYITMELVEGSSLQALLDQGQSFPLPRVLRLMEQACSALEFAHQRWVVHRDIKPANLMLTQDDQLKITDFGTAKILQMGATQTATVIGTPSYMSPEQIKGNPIDGRSDIFALGVILYELVTGQKPFPGDNVTTVIYRIVNEEPIPPRQIDSSIHPGLADVITHALAKDPAERFANCREMSLALQNYHRFGSGEPTVRLASKAPFPAVAPPRSAGRALRTTPRPTAHTPVPARISTGPITWQPEKPKRKHHVLLALVLLVLIGVAGSRAWPVLLDFWQTGVKPEVASHIAPIQWGAQKSAAPAVTSAPATSLAAQPLPVGKTSLPARAAAETKPAAKPVAPATDASPPADTEPRPTPAAEAAEKKIDDFLAGAGLTDAVQIHAAGDTLTLSGKLTTEQYRGLMSSLRDLPADVRVIDHIEFAPDSPENTSAVPPPVAYAAPATPGAVPPAAVPALTVTSQPDGANIFVNGQRQSTQTPAKFDLPAGTYRIALSKQGYEPYISQVKVQPGEPASVNADLAALNAGQGWVVARTVPKGASIAIDGVMTSQITPAKLDLSVGQHLLVFTLDGYTAEASIAVHPGKGSQVFQVLNRP
jgi:protein kinase-like protein/PEGA domain-containing protein